MPDFGPDGIGVAQHENVDERHCAHHIVKGAKAPVPERASFESRFQRAGAAHVHPVHRGTCSHILMQMFPILLALNFIAGKCCGHSERCARSRGAARVQQPVVGFLQILWRDRNHASHPLFRFGVAVHIAAVRR